MAVDAATALRRPAVYRRRSISGHRGLPRFGRRAPARRARPGLAGGLVAGAAGAARLALEREAMNPLQQPIEDRIGDGGVADPAVPVLDRQLMSDDRRPVPGAIVDDLRQIVARHRIDVARAPVVEDQYVGARELHQPFAEAAGGVQHTQFLGQARCAQVQSQRAGQPRPAQARGAPEQDGVATLDPAREGEAHERLALDAAHLTELGVLDGRVRVLQLRALQQPRALAIAARIQLAIDEQGEPFLEAQRLGLAHLFEQCVGEAEQFERAQVRDGGVIEHGRCPRSIRCHW